MANTLGEKELRTSYDEEDNQGEVINLVPENSVIPERKQIGIY